MTLEEIKDARAQVNALAGQFDATVDRLILRLAEERDNAVGEAERRGRVIRDLHAEKALAPGLECHCEFCESES